jgi:hypothetical protein
MVTKKLFFGYGTFSIKDGYEVRFWEDKWLRATTLLYLLYIKRGYNCPCYGVQPPNVMFRRSLICPRLVSCEALLQCLANVQLTNGKDKFRWNLHENGKFPVASMYNAMIVSDLPVIDNKKIWKMKIPLKDNFFT